MSGEKMNIIAYGKNIVSDVFKKKAHYHKKQARLPIEEKMKILVKLQEIALMIHPRRGPDDRRKIWLLQ